jgi:hypothetical protein
MSDATTAVPGEACNVLDAGKHAQAEHFLMREAAVREAAGHSDGAALRPQTVLADVLLAQGARPARVSKGRAVHV